MQVKPVAATAPPSTVEPTINGTTVTLGHRAISESQSSPQLRGGINRMSIVELEDYQPRLKSFFATDGTRFRFPSVAEKTLGQTLTDCLQQPLFTRFRGGNLVQGTDVG
jgi:hypothetical protein